MLSRIVTFTDPNDTHRSVAADGVTQQMQCTSADHRGTARTGCLSKSPFAEHGRAGSAPPRLSGGKEEVRSDPFKDQVRQSDFLQAAPAPPRGQDPLQSITAKLGNMERKLEDMKAKFRHEKQLHGTASDNIDLLGATSEQWKAFFSDQSPDAVVNKNTQFYNLYSGVDSDDTALEEDTLEEDSLLDHPEPGMEPPALAGPCSSQWEWDSALNKSMALADQASSKLGTS